MKVFQDKIALRRYIQELNLDINHTIGFVPTMGALHDGHISLIKQSKQRCNITIASIFVNPTQFNDINDFNKYPIQIDKDLEMLLEASCDIVYVPNVEEIYPNGVDEEKPKIDLGFLGTTLEAEKRPGHYEGVVQVVKKLLEIVQPDFLFLGQKDYQQCMVIQRLIDVFNIKTNIIICETMREKDGLAMSSRNMRLSSAERSVAVNLYQALKDIQDKYARENIETLIDNNIQKLNEESLIQVEYLVIVDGKTLENIKEYQENIPITTLIAAKVGNIRLIDNLILNR
ncbi:MAG: pantoate--beta-alanine ligase [Sphingobacteriales bacterium]|nr:MAG: pantoate--beta-alanine ligase [Sphingobacteriales bacterium]